MIPGYIWQTCLNARLPPPAVPLVESWSRLNPSWQHTVVDADGAEQLIRDNFDSDLLRVFREVPLRVMRADIWRYAVLRVNGGVYIDLDCECLVSLDDWLPRHKELVLAPENDVHFSQATMAARGGHVLFDHALELVLSRWWEGFDVMYPHFVHHHTGPGLWTTAVCRYLGCGDVQAGEALEAHGRGDSRVTFLDADTLAKTYIRHVYGSQVWRNEPDYEAWIDQTERLKVRYLNRPLRKDGWTLRPYRKGFLLVSPAGKTIECNDSAAWIFSRCDGSETMAEMAIEMRATVSDCPRDVAEQIEETMGSLVNLGVIDLPETTER